MARCCLAAASDRSGLCRAEAGRGSADQIKRLDRGRGDAAAHPKDWPNVRPRHYDSPRRLMQWSTDLGLVIHGDGYSARPESCRGPQRPGSRQASHGCCPTSGPWQRASARRQYVFNHHRLHPDHHGAVVDVHPNLPPGTRWGCAAPSPCLVGRRHDISIGLSEVRLLHSQRVTTISAACGRTLPPDPRGDYQLRGRHRGTEARTEPCRRLQDWSIPALEM